MEEKVFTCTVTTTYTIEAKDYYEAKATIHGYLGNRHIAYDSVEIEEVKDDED